MTAVPTAVIVLGVEERPRVRLVCLHESDQIRLLDWIQSSPELAELFERGLELAREAA